MNGSGAGGTQAGTELAGQLSLRRGCKSTGFFVAHLNKLNIILTPHRIGHGIDGIAGNTKQLPDTISRQHLQQHI